MRATAAALCAIILIGGSSMSLLARPEIVAHRGASADAPENTLASVNLAWSVNTDAVEIDVYLTSDGKIITSHDRDTLRTSGVKHEIKQTDFATLRSLDVGKWKGEKFAGEKMPSFEEVLATIPDGKRLFVEVKCGPEIVPELKRQITASGKTSRQVAIISFNADVIEAVKKAMPQLQAYWLCSAAEGKADEQIATAKRVNANGIDIQGNAFLTAEYAKAITDAGLRLYVWTIDDPARAKELAAIGSEGITTNKPALMLKAFRVNETP